MSQNNISNVVNGEMFIIPNCLRYNMAEEYDVELFHANMRMWNKTISKLDLPTDWLIREDDCNRVVQVWTCGHGSDNWSNHRVDLGDKSVYWPCVLPARILMDLKEGDTLSFTANGMEFNITARQLAYRYRNFGPFEEVLAKLIA